MTDGTYNPWAVINAHRHWTLSTWEVDLDGEHGRWYQRLRVLVVDRRLGRIGRRVAAAHEVEHALHGDTPCATSELEARQELIRHRDAARKLIDVHRLADLAATYPEDPHRVAEELDVDYDTLMTRLRWLHPAERHYLRERLSAHQDIA